MTSNSDKRMFSILVSYFDEMKVESVVKDYEYIDCKGVNVKKIFAEICKLFNRDEIPCGNLVSELFESTNYIRGKKSGFETKLIYFTLMATYVIISTTPLKNFVLLLIIF